MAGRSTIVKPPPDDPEKAPIENILEITQLGVLGPDIFTNTRPPWHPAGARGIFGGVVIAQCLAAAQKTVPDDFAVHSCHCYFLLAGGSETPILFHVERVRDGRSFAARTVQARQLGRCIFTTTISFTRTGSGGANTVQHATPMRATPPPDDWDDVEAARGGWAGPYQAYRMETVGVEGGRSVADVKDGDLATPPEQRKCTQWIRARGKISESGGYQAHLNAVAYMSDSFFIGTVPRVHRIWRFSGVSPEDIIEGRASEDMRDKVERLHAFEGLPGKVEDWVGRPELGMMVSLDHSIYFHDAKGVKADEWMYSEMETPWAGDGRGVVVQRIFSKDGRLLATCMQEGLVRLKQDGKAKPTKL